MSPNRWKWHAAAILGIIGAPLVMEVPAVDRTVHTAALIAARASSLVTTPGVPEGIDLRWIDSAGIETSLLVKASNTNGASPYSNDAAGIER